MRQRITFDIEWAPCTPGRTMGVLYRAVRDVIIETTKDRSAPFYCSRVLAESSDTRITKE